MDITITLGMEETIALAKAVQFRQAYLSRQPASEERNEEMHALTSIAMKAKQQMSANAQKAQRDMRNSQN